MDGEKLIRVLSLFDEPYVYIDDDDGYLKVIENGEFVAAIEGENHAGKIVISAFTRQSKDMLSTSGANDSIVVVDACKTAKGNNPRR